jgi:hypothetical protein
LKVKENLIMRTSIPMFIVSGLALLSLAACSGASNEPVDQSAQAETANLSAVPATAPASSATPTAEPRARRAPDPAALVKRFDKNGDGVLQISELPEPMQKWFAKADSNGDGALSVAELQASEDKRRAEHLAKVDTNHDGVVSPEERKAAFEKFAQARFAKLDKNSDGVLTKDEVGERRWARLSVADADKNGSLTSAEIQQAVASGTLKFPHRGPGHRGPREDGSGPSTAPAAPKPLPI